MFLVLLDGGDRVVLVASTRYHGKIAQGTHRKQLTRQNLSNLFKEKQIIKNSEKKNIKKNEKTNSIGFGEIFFRQVDFSQNENSSLSLRIHLGHQIYGANYSVNNSGAN